MVENNGQVCVLIAVVKQVTKNMPLKVDSMTSHGPSLTMVHDKDDDRVQDADTDFSTELMDQQDSLSTEQMDKLLKQIDEQGSPALKTFKFMN